MPIGFTGNAHGANEAKPSYAQRTSEMRQKSGSLRFNLKNPDPLSLTGATSMTVPSSPPVAGLLAGAFTSSGVAPPYRFGGV